MPASVEFQCCNQRVRFGDRKTRRTELAVILNFFWRKSDVNRAGNTASAKAGKDSNHHFKNEAVADGEEHAVSGMQTGSDQSACNLVDSRVPLRISQCANAIRMGNIISLMVSADLESVRNPPYGYARCRIGEILPCAHSVTLLPIMRG